MLYVNLFNKIKYFLFSILFATNCFANNLNNEVQKNNIKLINNKTNIRAIKEDTKFIKNIIFKDNSKIKKEELELEMKFRKKSAFNENIVKEDLERIKNLYIKKGFYDINISYELQGVNHKEDKNFAIEQNVFDLVFFVKEGKKAKINNVSFIGNKKFSEKELRSIIFSKKHNPIFFLSSKHKFEENHKELNEMFLAKFFLTHGYIDFKIVDIETFALRDENNRPLVNLLITLEEGEQFKLGAITVANNTNILDDESLLEVIDLKEDDIYNMEQIQQTLLKLENVLKNKNISSYIKIEPNIIPNYSSNIVNIQFVVMEMPKQYIGNIKIINNEKTYNYVILDNLYYSEGDIYTPFIQDSIKTSLINTGFFEDVQIITLNDSLYKNKVNIILDVKEKRTGTFNAGVSLSTQDGLSFNVGLSNTNFAGKGINIRSDISIGQYSKYINFGFDKNNIFNSRFYGGIDFNLGNIKLIDRSLFNLSSGSFKRDYEKMYEEQYFSITPFINLSLSKNINMNLYYSLEFNKLSNINTTLYDIVNRNSEIKSLVGTNFIYDTRDDYRYPLKGSYNNIDFKLAGLGGNKRFVEINLKLSTYIRLYKEIVFKPQISAGYKTSYLSNGNNDKYKLYPNDGFILGYDKIRGFDFGGINPRVPFLDKDGKHDYERSSLLGGTKYFTFNTDLIFPLFRKNNIGVFAYGFLSGGTVFGLENNKNVIIPDYVKYSKMLRVATGLGLAIQTPFAVFSIEFAKPLKYHELDNREKIRFEIGKTF